MKKVGIATALLSVVLALVLSGCSSINAPTPRQIMTVYTPAQAAQSIFKK